MTTPCTVTALKTEIRDWVTQWSRTLRLIKHGLQFPQLGMNKYLISSVADKLPWHISPRSWLVIADGSLGRMRKEPQSSYSWQMQDFTVALWQREWRSIRLDKRTASEDRGRVWGWGEGIIRRRCVSIVQWLWDKTTVIHIPSPP